MQMHLDGTSTKSLKSKPLFNACTVVLTECKKVFNNTVFMESNLLQKKR